MPPLQGSLASPRLHVLRAARNTFGVRSLLLRQEEDSAPEPSCCCCCCSSIPTPADWIIKLNTCRQSHSNPATLLGSLVPPGRLWPSTRERLSEKQARKGAEESGGRGRTAERCPREGAPRSRPAPAAPVRFPGMPEGNCEAASLKGPGRRQNQRSHPRVAEEIAAQASRQRPRFCSARRSGKPRAEGSLGRSND
ncbi:Hypothetical predicted protein [Podarcis lilfordi]|uniref:Uncharacterized protein n=1 Tax=Podarcis lilfordi TaxID=74358 RepID=A0AA35P3G2_9SAUR|nr:Hypothetical predicted protein [Podarcis lilfordi]